MLIELITHLPCTHLMPASITDHLDESNITGTREISGSDAIRCINRCITAAESNKPSSILTSIICAPSSTCWRATFSAVSNSPSLIKRRNTAEPVTLVRSPTLTNKESCEILHASKPDNRHMGSMLGIVRGDSSSIISRNAAMCAGVVPQQPPIIFRKPLRAHWPISSAICSGVSS